MTEGGTKNWAKKKSGERDATGAQDHSWTGESATSHSVNRLARWERERERERWKNKQKECVQQEKKVRWAGGLSGHRRFTWLLAHSSIASTNWFLLYHHSTPPSQIVNRNEGERRRIQKERNKEPNEWHREREGIPLILASSSHFLHSIRLLTIHLCLCLCLCYLPHLPTSVHSGSSFSFLFPHYNSHRSEHPLLNKRQRERELLESITHLTSTVVHNK